MSKLVFLGTGAGAYRGSKRNPASVYYDGLLLDCGAGAAGRLEDLGLVTDVHAVLLTHLHSDHISGLYDFLVHQVVARRTEPLAVYGPPGLSKVVRTYEEVGNKFVDEAHPYTLDINEIPPSSFSVGAFKIEAVTMDHAVTDYGYLVRKGGKSLFYTGDTREPSAARVVKADYLIHEAAATHTFLNTVARFGHSTALQAAETAEAMGCRRLFITHVSNRMSGEADILKEALDHFPDTVLAEDWADYAI